jgi:DNA polymerase I
LLDLQGKEPGSSGGVAMINQVWFVDFEYYCPEGELPVPLCMVAHELHSKRWVRLSRGEFGSKPPYPTDDTAIFVSFAADAELSCHLALGWPLPPKVIDPHVEFLNASNYLERSGKFEDSSLLAVCARLKIDCGSPHDKEKMRSLAMSGGPNTPEEAAALLDYCQSDVEPMPEIYRRLIGPGNMAQALERGRYMKAVTIMEWLGIPIDVKRLTRFRDKWESIKWRLIREVDKDFKVFDGAIFSHDKFKHYVSARGLVWPTTDSGTLLKTDKDTFKEKILAYPEIAPLHELKSTLALMRRESITVGSDGRNRTSLHAFRSKTSRNQPSASKFIFSAPSWMRSFVKPEPGSALAYIDFEQEEFGIAAVLSGDEAMKRAYVSGDPYLAFAKMAGAVPDTATKKSHPVTRELFKTCALGIQYSMQAPGLASRIGQPVSQAELFVGHHRKQFPDFWHWVDRVCTHMEFYKSLCTKSGWRVVRRQKQFPSRSRRSIQNWPIQSAGADLLRRVCCLATEQGIRVLAPVHDAIVVEDSADRIEQTVADAREIMRRASMDLLDGFEIRTEAEIFRERFTDKRGIAMWNRINQLMDESDAEPVQMSLFEPAPGP